MLTYAMATQHGRQGVRTNAIAPGLIVTPIVREVASELISLVHRHTPSPELGEPEDIASLCAFLAADESKFVNGQISSCDGGLMKHLPQVAKHSEWDARHRKQPGQAGRYLSSKEKIGIVQKAYVAMAVFLVFDRREGIARPT